MIFEILIALFSKIGLGNAIVTIGRAIVLCILVVISIMLDASFIYFFLRSFWLESTFNQALAISMLEYVLVSYLVIRLNEWHMSNKE